MNILHIKVVGKDEFTQMMIENLLHDKKDWTLKDVFSEVVNHGFPRLDFENLDKSLSDNWVYIWKL